MHEHCPGCKNEWIDFDGCSALTCLCGTYFCAHCCGKFDTDALVHTHVKHCALNPNMGSLYTPFAVYKEAKLGRWRARVQHYLDNNIIPNQRQAVVQQFTARLVEVFGSAAGF